MALTLDPSRIQELVRVLRSAERRLDGDLADAGRAGGFGITPAGARLGATYQEVHAASLAEGTSCRRRLTELADALHGALADADRADVVAVETFTRLGTTLPGER